MVFSLVHNGVYTPAEDSFLLSEVLKKELKNEHLDNIKCLDIGSGSGIQSKTLISLGVNPKNILLTDINPESIKHLKKIFPNSKIIKSDLFEKIKGKFDLIVFNPPYLPENKYDKEKDTTGGKQGGELINKFLKQAKEHLNKNGKIFLLTSSLKKGIKWQAWKKKMLASKKLFFEELYVWELVL